MVKANNPIRIKIFSTKSGVNIVQSPIKAQILSILKEGGLSGSQIVSATKRSKSTISAHLQDLEDAGIIDWVIDPDDRRRKIYFINSRFLGDLSSPREIEDDMNDFLEEYVSQSDDPFKFFRYMFRTIRVALLDEGINIDPILHNAGFKVGSTFYNKLKGRDLNELTKNLTSFWEANNLGNIEIQSIKPLIIQSYDCFECEDLPQLGKPACAFDSGLLEGIFSNYYGQEVEAEETKCYAQGDNLCQFVIKPVPTDTH